MVNVTYEVFLSRQQQKQMERIAKDISKVGCFRPILVVEQVK